MTAAVSEHSTAAQPAAHPRSRSMESWRARKAVMASRGETDGPRVAEADAALSWWRVRAFLVKEMSISPAQAEELLEIARQPDAQTVEAVAR